MSPSTAVPLICVSLSTPLLAATGVAAPLVWLSGLVSFGVLPAASAFSPGVSSSRYVLGNVNLLILRA